MASCPHCRQPLETHRQREGLFYRCPGCDGRAVTYPQIRRVTGDAYVTRLMRAIRLRSVPGGHPCPFCGEGMRELHARNPDIEVDACRPCQVVWFDGGEFQQIPEGVVASVDSIRMQGLDAVARHRLALVKERQEAEGGGEPDEIWQWVPAVYGFPVESNAAPLTRVPMVTWALAAVVLTVSLVAFRDLPGAIGRFGFIPATALRGWGLTALTAFFLHAGVSHLLGNLYFLLILGDNVEDFLGRVRYGLLLAGATVSGAVVHWAMDPRADVPCIGASGGISGVILFYALLFPRAKLGFFLGWGLRGGWFRMPVLVALGFWLAVQGWQLYQQHLGLGRVAATAHLGGALAGLVAWIAWRPRRVPDPEDESA